MVELVTEFGSRPETRLLQLLLSCFGNSHESQGLKGLLYLGIGFDTFPEERKPYAAEKIAPTLLTLSKGPSARMREKSTEFLNFLQPHLGQPSLPAPTQILTPQSDLLLQWVTSGPHPQLQTSGKKTAPSVNLEAVLSALQVQENFLLLLSYGFDVTAGTRAKAMNSQDKTIAVLTDVTNTSKVMKFTGFSACQCVCTPHTDSHIERIIQLRLESDDIDRMCRLLSCWMAKDSKKMIACVGAGQIIRTLVAEYIQWVSVQNLCLFVFLFNSMLTHEAATLLLRELSHEVISSLASVLSSIPRSKEELPLISGALNVLSYVVHHISLSAQLVAIDEVKLEESKSSTQSLGPLK